MVESQFLFTYSLIHSPENSLVRIVDTYLHLSQAVDKECCGSGGRLQPCVRDDVEHALIAVVSYCGDDWQRTICNFTSQIKRIEPRKIAGCSPTPCDDDTIEMGCLVFNAVDGGNDALFHPLALHDSLKQLCVERIAMFILIKMIAKIPIPGSSGT